MSVPWRVVSGVVAATTITMLVGGCGPSGADEDNSSPSTAGSTSAGDPAGESPASLPEDICSVVTAAELSEAIGATVTTKTGPSGDCEFSQEDPRALSGSVGVVRDAETNGGYQAYLSGLSGSLTGSKVKEISGLGDAASVYVGSFGTSSNLTAGGVVDRGSYLVVATLVQSQGDSAEKLDAVAESLLKVLDGKLG